MITIISGTNRRNSNTLLVSEFLQEHLDDHGDIKLLDLKDFPLDAIHPDMYNKEGQQHSIRALQDEYMVPADKFIFVIPEYNGGSPGILKLFIDACSARAYEETFNDKKALLIGVSNGRAGNLRGIEQFTLILNYLGVTVYPYKQPISRVSALLDENGNIKDKATQKVLSDLLEAFLEY